MLKNCFQSLKELHFQILLQRMHQYVILWITCCLILHNLIIHIEEQLGTFDILEWYDPDKDGKGEDEEGKEGEGLPIQPIADGLIFRENVMRALLDSNQL
jgi:hypothetical protein